MKHDGVTLAEPLALPLQELYQEAMVKLVGLIVAEQEDLSPDSKRTLFAEYMHLIVERFAGASDNDRFQEETARQKQERSREEEARRYEEARQGRRPNEIGNLLVQNQIPNRDRSQTPRIVML